MKCGTHIKWVWFLLIWIWKCSVKSMVDVEAESSFNFEKCRWHIIVFAFAFFSCSQLNWLLLWLSGSMILTWIRFHMIPLGLFSPHFSFSQHYQLTDVRDKFLRMIGFFRPRSIKKYSIELFFLRYLLLIIRIFFINCNFINILISIFMALLLQANAIFKNDKW